MKNIDILAKENSGGDLQITDFYYLLGDFANRNFNLGVIYYSAERKIPIERTKERIRKYVETHLLKNLGDSISTNDMRFYLNKKLDSTKLEFV